MKHICFHSNVLFRSSIFWGDCLRLSATLLENCGHRKEGRVDHSMSEIQMFLTKVTPCCDAIKTHLKVIQNAFMCLYGMQGVSLLFLMCAIWAQYSNAPTINHSTLAQYQKDLDE